MSQKSVLVYGGAGVLGSCIVKYLRDKDYWVCSLDLVDNPDADVSVTVDINKDWIPETQSVNDRVRNALNNNMLDGIVNVAGGWCSGNCLSKSFLSDCDLMWREMVWTSTISAMLATEYLKPNGVLILSGDAQALYATPGTIAYGMSKAAVHHLTKSLANPSSGLPSNTFVACILPVVLDTPSNRAVIALGDFDRCTPLDFVAQLCEKWLHGKDRPKNGSLVRLETENYNTGLFLS